MTTMKMPFLSEYDKARFWSKVKVGKKGKCWPWSAGTDECGYGKFRIAGKSYMANRITFQLLRGKVPVSLCVCHICDNPPCCNPDHLWLGTFGENMEDKVQKGRCNAVRGEEHHKAVLSAYKVREIRHFLKQNLSVEKLAQRYEVGTTTIYSIKNNITWRHVR